MKFVLLLVACVAFASATNSRQTEDDASVTRENRESRQTESEESRRLVTRKEKEEFNRHPDEIVLLNGVQQCILCRETWSEALNSFSTDSPLNADGVITSDKTCRFACRGEALKKIRNMEEQEKNELVCESCRIGMDFWRAQPSKKVHYQLAKDNMCKSFTTQITREDCEHTVRMYGFDIFNALRNDVSSSSICHMYNLCGRQAATAEFSWEEDRSDDLIEKDLESVSLDELVRNRESSESTKTVTQTNSQEENGETVSTERTSSEERERLSKKTRQEQREARRERRRQERKERHERERAEQARRHAEEMRKEESAAVSSEELQ